MLTFLPVTISVKHLVSKLSFLITLILLASFLDVSEVQAQKIEKLEQSANGKLASPKSPVDWVTGNVNAAKAHYTECMVVPYHLEVINLDPAVLTYSITIGWDTKKNGVHALDYLTSFDFEGSHDFFNHDFETINPLENTALFGSGLIADTKPIPTPGISTQQPAVAFLALDPSDRVMSIYNGKITRLTYTQGDLSVATQSDLLQIEFTVDAGETVVVLAWAAHIAAQTVWGPGESASSIPGSPYHTFVDDCVDLAGCGNKEVQLQASAVEPPPECDVTGPDVACQGEEVVFTATTDDPANTFKWEIVNNTSDASIVGSNTNSTVTVNAGTSGGSFDIQVMITKELTGGTLTSTCGITNVKVDDAVTADAGDDQVQCENTAFTVTGSAAEYGTGIWSIISGDATIDATNGNEATVTVADGATAVLAWTVTNGECSASDQISLTNGVDITASAVATDVSCYDDDGNSGNGSITVTVAGGVGDLTYAWTVPAGASAPGNVKDLTGLSVAGLYTVVVTDASGNSCSTSTNETISVPALFKATSEFTDVSCYDDDGNSGNGSITVTVAGGVGDLTYAWTVPAGASAPGNVKDLTGLSVAGLYTVVVTDASGNSCSTSTNETISVPALFKATSEFTDVSCYDDDGNSGNGSITVTVAGGVGDLTYAWTVPAGASAPGNVKDLTGLSVAGLYTVVVTDASGNSCSTSTNETISVPALFKATSEFTDVSCYDDDGNSGNGSITVTVAGGVGDLTYAWTVPAGASAPGNVKDLTGLSVAGLYTVVVTDASGNSCSTSTNETISVPALFKATSEFTDVSCYDDDGNSGNGSITVTVAGGVGDLTYAWTVPAGASAPGNVKDLTGLSVAGLYTVVVTDASGNSCSTSTNETISVPALFKATSEFTDVSCYDDDGNSGNGSITVTVAGGVGDLTYAWTVPAGASAPGNVKDLTGLSVAGLYTVVVTDASGNSCSTSTNETISVPALFKATSEFTDVSCYDDDGNSGNGSITVTVAGGVGDLTYAWTVPAGASAPGNVKDLTGLSVAGLYTVVVTDASGNSCSTSTNETISVPALFKATSEFTDVSCYDDDGNSGNGSITVTVAGGVGDLTYAWTVPAGASAPGNVKDLTGLSVAGLYTVVVTDASGNSCSTSTNETISVPALFKATSEFTDVSCYDDDGNSGNGSITVTVAGGVGDLTYAWTVPAGASAPGNVKDLTGLSVAGLYTVVVTDASGNSCSTSTNETISVPALFKATSEFTDVSCYDDDGNSGNGSITVTVAGGVGDLTYAWTVPAGASAPGNVKDLTGLSVAGLYTVVVTDASGNSCSTSTNETISVPALFKATSEFTDVSCYDDDGNSGNGSITVTVAGGVGDLTYAWTVPAGASAPGNVKDLTGLSVAGLYTVVVTDASGNSCSTSTNETISVPALFKATSEFTDVSCYDDDGNSGNGSITVTVAGGVGDLTYAWTVPAGASAPGNVKDLTGLSVAGLYTVVVTDASGNSCSTSTNETISVPALFKATSEFTDVSCYDDDGNSGNGSITVTVAGGVGDLTYAWTVPAGASAPGNVKDLTGLSVAGLYTVVVTDASGNSCSTSTNETISVPALFKATSEFTDVSCYDDDGNSGNGSITVTVAGGVGDLTYAWTVPAGASAPGNVKDLTGLSVAGLYTVVVTDASGNSCSTSTNETISVPALFKATSEFTDVSCYDDDGNSGNGSITVTVAGGVGDLTYAWTVPAGASAPGNVKDLTGLSVAGLYTVVVTDASGNSCSTSTNETISVPALFKATSEFTDVSCYDDDGNSGNGSITVTVAGGVGDLTYAWTVPAGASAPGNVKDLTGLSVAGLYTVVVTDASGNSCSTSTNETISVPALFKATSEFTDVSCYDDDGNSGNGSITVTVAGGVGDLTYAWTVPAGASAPGNVKDLTGLSVAGLYTVVVTDASGNSCSTSTNETISVPALFKATSEFTDVSCYDDDGNSGNGSITVTVAGGVGDLTYAWTVPAGASAPGNVKDLTGLSVAGLYTVVVTDASGNSCSTSTNETISVPALFKATSEFTDVSCYDDDGNSGNGSITVTVAGGVGDLTYAWTVPAGASAPGNVKDLTGLSVAGLYTVVVTDASGNSCSTSTNETISVPALFKATSEFTDVSCYDDDGNSGNGSITVTVAGGVGDLTYAWTVPAGASAPGNVKDLTGLSVAGLYTVVVTDASGNSCSTSTNETISVPDPFTAVAVPTDASCLGDESVSSDGSIDLTLTNGIADFTYSWTGPDGFTASTEDLSGLAPGTYYATITDATGCTASTQATVNPPSDITHTIEIDASSTTEICFGLTNGVCNTTIVGGSEPISYQWYEDIDGDGTFDIMNGETNASLLNLGKGTYKVITIDADGCSASDIETITEPAAPLAIEVADASICYGEGVSLTANFSDWPGFPGFTQLGSGGPYTYKWTVNSTVNAETGATLTLTGLTADQNISVEVTDNGTGANCTATTTATVTVNPELVLTPSGTDVVCYDDNGLSNNGTASVSVSGGTAPYSYAWTTTDGSGLIPADKDQSGLAAGTYNVLVTDAAECTNTTSVTIEAPLQLSASAVPTAITCYDDAGYSADGAIAVTVTNPQGVLSYVWTVPAGAAAPGNVEDLSGLNVPGLYSVVVTDATGGCVANASATIEAPLLLSAAAVPTAITCYDDAGYSADGAIAVTVTNPQGLLSYVWTVPAGAADPGDVEDLSGLNVPGLYSVVVTDATGGCIARASATIEAPLLLSASAAPTAITCYDDAGYSADGAIAVTVTNPQGVLSYVWTVPAGAADPGNVEDLSGLNVPGLYSVVVTDATGGCIARTSATIEAPLLLSASAVPTAITCYDDAGYSADGAIAVTVTNPQGVLSYVWTVPAGAADPGDVEDLSGLNVPGLYSVVVTDATGGCIARTSATIEAPLLLSASAVPTAITCYDDAGYSADGAIAVTVTNPQGLLSYVWTVPAGAADPGDVEDLSGLNVPGLYSVVVTDAIGGCIARTSATIEAPLLFTATAVSTPVQCDDDAGASNDGTATVSLTNGVGVFTYLWNDPLAQTTQTATALASGDYSVTVTDVNGCEATALVTIDPAVPFSASAVSTPSTCDDDDGTATVSTTNGVAPFTYLWSDGQITITAINLASGDYNVIVTDASGCTATADVTVVLTEDNTPPVITCPPDVTVTCEDTDPSNTGTATATDDCGVLITYTDVWFIPPPPPANGGCICDGGMVTLTVEYNGSAGATVDVYYDAGVLLKTFTNVQLGQLLTVDATTIGQTKFKADTRFSVNGGPEIKIHTSCSKYILGRVIGDFTVKGWSDGSGNTCDETVPQILSCDCDGGMIELSVRYDGTSGNTVTVEYDAGIILETFNNVQNGEVLTVISWTINQNKLKSTTSFFVNGQETTFHTSCSQSIKDLTIGDFTVVGWLDGDGQICGFSPQEEESLSATITRTWTATDPSGNSSSCVQIITLEDDTTPPVITCPADVTLTCADDDTSPAITGMATATDNCSDPIITYIDTVIPTTPQPGFSCSCDGGMVTLTVQYDGPNNATVEVFYDTGVPLATFNNVQSGQWLTVDATTIGQAKFKADTRFSINGEPEIKIHTSCSKYILGRVVGPLTVIGWTDGSGNTCDETVPLIQSCDCDGGMIELSVEYNGPAGATVTAEYDAGVSLGTFTNVQPGDIISVISWTANQNKLKADTRFFVDGGPERKFHSSCSQSIMDQTIEEFTVVGWLDANGQVCGFSAQDGGLNASITRTWTATDASGNSSSCVQIITIEDDSTPPVITCPAVITLACEEDTSPVNTGMATATDNCDADPVITYTDIVIPTAPQPGFSCGCDGGMVTLTVEYNGPVDALVDVYYDASTLLATFINVQPGETLTVDATAVGQTKLKADTRFYVNNGAETKIHTSCSKYVLGRVVDEFTVIGWTDGSDNTCDETVPIVQSCDCDGGMIELSVEYNGPAGATVTTLFDASTSLGTFTNVQPGEIITVISWDINQNKLKRDTKFFVDGGAERKFHTSCSQSIMDQTVDEFTVVGWLDAGGQVCGFSIEGNDGQACNESTIERTWTATDASGNVASCTQTILIIDSSDAASRATTDSTVEIRADELTESDELIIYPNPVSDHLTIVFGSYEEKTIRIFDNMGRVVYNYGVAEGVKLHRVNTIDYAGGSYVILIESNENGVIRDRFILSH